MNCDHVLYSFSQRFGLPGIGTTAWYQVSELVKLGIKVTLFCGSCERDVPGIHRVVETMQIAGVPLPYRLIGNNQAFRFHDWAVSRELEKQGTQEKTFYDVIHCWPLGSLRTLQVAKRKKIASVLERPNTHTAFAYEAIREEYEKLGVPVDANHSHTFSAQRLRIEETEYELADVIACPSDFVASTFLARGFDPSKIGRHQYGYDPEKFGTAPIERPSNHPVTTIFVGRCEPRKGLHFALDAWHRSGASREGKFVICGSFVPGYRKGLHKWLDMPGVEERGYIDDVRVEMRKADLLILPSIEEGSALVTYEARACGCVLMVSDAAGAKLQDGRHGFVHRAGDVEQLSAQLHALVSDPLRLAAMRANSLRELGDLTWSAAARAQCALYEKAIRGLA